MNIQMHARKAGYIMQLNIALCDDELSQIQYLHQLLMEWAALRGHVLCIAEFISSESFLFHYEDNKSFDLLLLDIEMGKMNGVELALRLRQMNREIQIVFVTGYMEYIAAGYDVEALHYLLKPVTAEKLYPVLDRACERMKQREKVFLFETADGMVRIPVYEIRYLEVQKNYVTIHGEETYTVKSTLSCLEEKLDEGFFRTGRSFLINLRFVRRTSKTEVYLKDGTVIPLSRGLYDALNQALIRYF